MNLQFDQANNRKRARLNTILNQLSIFVMLAGVLTIDRAFTNAWIVLFFELAFAGYYTFFKYSVLSKSPGLKCNWIVIVFVAAWIVSVTASLLMSPLNLITEHLAVARFFQTLIHVYFFYIVFDFLKRFPFEPEKLLLAVPASSIIVVIGMATAVCWFLFAGQIDELNWFQHPPFNSHIRHSGYQVAAGLAVLLGYLAVDNRPLSEGWLKLVILLILTTFMFWMGGRGSIVSVIFGGLAISLILMLKKMPWLRFCIVFAVALGTGALLSEVFAVFSWNGIFPTLERTADADGINQLASGRIDFWKLSFASFLESPIIGVGPQSYHFLPDRTFGVQPHSVIFQFLLEWGILGTAIFSGLLIVGFIRGLKCHIVQAKQGIVPARLAAGSVIVVLSFHALFDGTYYHPQPSLYLAMCYAFWVSKPQQRE